MELHPGQRVLERYVIERRLGSGSMGDVFLATHAHLGVRVALKVIAHGDHDSLLARFEQEAKLMARVRHPNVVSVTDYGFLDDGAPCIVMEYIEGEDLDARIAQRTSLPWPVATRILWGVVEGLHAIHEASIVHRDLKPSNVLLTRGEREVPKLIDFGIARPMEVQGRAITQRGVVVGTPAYMAPEQLVGATLNARTDLYAAALIWYEMVTGVVPFGSNDMAELMRRMTDRVPPPEAPSHHPPIPDKVRDAIVPVLVADARQRPASAREWLVRIQQAVNSLPPELRRSSSSSSSVPRITPTPPTPPPAPRSPPPVPRTPPPAPRSPPPATLAEAVEAVEVVEVDARYLFVAKLPASRLAARDERRWLAELLGTSGRSYTFGAQLWFALRSSPATEAEARREAEGIAAALQVRYGDNAKSGWSIVDGTFALTASVLSGAGQLPPALRALVDRLA